MKLTLALSGIVSFAVCAACASPKPDADSTAALPAPDTIKAGPSSAQSSDSVARVDSTPGSTTATPTTKAAAKAPAPVTKSPPATTKTAPQDIPGVGRDSVITRRPRRLPPDTPSVP